MTRSAKCDRLTARPSDSDQATQSGREEPSGGICTIVDPVNPCVPPDKQVPGDYSSVADRIARPGWLTAGADLRLISFIQAGGETKMSSAHYRAKTSALSQDAVGAAASAIPVAPTTAAPGAP